MNLYFHMEGFKTISSWVLSGSVQKACTSRPFGCGSNLACYLHVQHVRPNILFQRDFVTLEVFSEIMGFCCQRRRKTTCSSFTQELKRLCCALPSFVNGV